MGFIRHLHAGLPFKLLLLNSRGSTHASPMFPIVSHKLMLLIDGVSQSIR